MYLLMKTPLCPLVELKIIVQELDSEGRALAGWASPVLLLRVLKVLLRTLICFTC